MNFLPRNAVVIGRRAADADFAESAIADYGFNVSRYDSAKSFADALEGSRSERNGTEFQTPSLAILAGSIDDLASEQQAAALHAASPELPVVATGSSGTIKSAVDLMKQGARDVVDLPCDRETFWKRLRETIDEADLEIAANLLTTEMRARYRTLTPAEIEVLDAMLDGLANKDIAQQLGIGLRTVELRRSKIMRKMEAKSVAELVKFVCMSGGISNSAG